MSLSNDQAIKAVKSPKNQSQIAKGRNYQSSFRVLTLPLGADDLQKETAWNEINNGLKSKLTAQKYNAISRYWTIPLSINVMANDVALDLFKVFDGRNAVFSVEYPHDRIKDVAEPMLTALNVRNWIEKVGKEVLVHSPNTIVVIDKDSNGDPILLSVPNERLVSYEFVNGSDSEFSYVAFIHSEGKTESGDKWTRYGVYDNEYYRVIYSEGGNYQLEIENTHTLGSCPARFYYNKPLTNSMEFNRCIPFSPVRGVMLQWQLFDLFEYYQDHYAAFQVVQYADSGCSQEDCLDGVVYINPVLDENNVETTAGYNTECPTCAKKSLVGPGSALGVVVSTDPADNDTRDIFKFIAPDVTSLEYVGTKQAGRQNFIKENTVGFSDAVTSEAVNETQIKALVESRKKPLLDIKSYLDDLDKWIVESTVKLVYDVDVVASSNYGTEFFVLSVDDIITLITAAKAAGAQSSYIEQLNKLLIATEYKNDPMVVQKMSISADLEPNAYDSQAEAREKFKEGSMTRDDYYKKSNITDLINKFERDNGSIVTFGMELPYSTKIDRINTTLDFYIQQKITKDEANNEAEPTATSDTGVEQS